MYAVNHLYSNVYDNEIHYDLTEEEINEIKETINTQDFETIDVIIDFANSSIVKKIIAGIPENLDKKSITIEVWQQYLFLELLKQLQLKGIVTNYIDIESQAEIIFGGNFRDVYELEFANFSLIDMDLRKKLEKRLRIHFFMDNISDVELQRCVNSLFASRLSSIFIGYTTAEELITYNTLNNQMLEAVHDYREFHNDEYYQKLEAKRIAFLRRFEQ